MADWAHTRVPDRQRKRVRLIALGSLIPGTVTLVLLAARTDNTPAHQAKVEQERRKLQAQPIHFGSSAALRLLDGRVVSGDAAVSVLPSGEYVVRFLAPEQPAAVSR
jgi:hypothetical protein